MTGRISFDIAQCSQSEAYLLNHLDLHCLSQGYTQTERVSLDRLLQLCLRR